ncbi:MAG: peptidyl-prolyl cis-trans isomerase [Candidatus Marinimicrobia bacterium]|nr:peptidyl-prolyl cis-trans isomerase [Candidatus Neomarinimicrobiota bacterium]
MKKTIFILISIFLLTGCHKKNKGYQYIARVDDSFLTQEELLEMIERKTTGGIKEENFINSIITDWVKDEIIFQKAKKEHFDKDKNIKNKVEDYCRSLVIDEYLKNHFQSTVTISNKEIEDFYESNKESFLLEKDALKISHIFVEDYNDANIIKSTLQSINIKDKKELYKKYKFETRIIKKGEVVKDINTELFERSTLRIVGPVSSNYGFHIIEILEQFKNGEYLPLDAVRDDIYEILMQQKNKSEYIVFTDSIISIADFEIKKEKLEQVVKSK